MERECETPHAGGTTARALGVYYPDAFIDGVELDPAVSRVGRRYFAMDENPRLTVRDADARPFLRSSDELYDLIFVRPAKWLGYTLWKRGDGWLIDGFGPDGVSARVLDVTRNVVRLQTGYLYHYAFAMLIGAALLITWFMFYGAR